MNQTAFRAALLNPDLPAPAGVVGPGGTPAGRRFSVYRNNVAVGLTDALRQSFPVIRALVGEDFFTALARDHLRAHPPTSPLMMFYGADMPAFLSAFAPAAHLGYLPDIARLELALRQAYHAADATPVAADRLRGMAPDRLMVARLHFAPAMRLLRSDWPIHAIWMANSRGTPPPAATVGEDVLILRPEFDPEPYLLPAGAAPFIAALQAGRTFGEAFDAADAFDLTATLGLLLAGGAITDTD